MQHSEKLSGSLRKLTPVTVDALETLLLYCVRPDLNTSLSPLEEMLQRGKGRSYWYQEKAKKGPAQDHRVLTMMLISIPCIICQILSCI